jgi:hypothetical protein
MPSDQINKESDSYFFASGIAGIGWMINHIKNKKFINVDLDDIFTDINIYMFKALQYRINKNEYDFLYGYLGIVFYFLQQPEIKMRNEAITQIIPCLKTSAIKGKNKNGRIMYKWISEILDENSQWHHLIRLQNWKIYEIQTFHGFVFS